ncbi:hypothetical protein APF79_04505 [bacterium BRH_c32]|nr:MAG: hypothetical protein APF79_04505 [bacterium BRH_c32]
MGKKILIIGATGMLGESVARRLNEDGFSIRVFTRDIHKARKLFGESFEIVMGEVTESKSIESALDGCCGVHINLSGEIEQVGVEIIASAAIKKNIKRITYISGTSVAEDTAWFPQTKRKLMAEKAIKESGVPYCIFCPTWFMESLPKYVKGSKAFVFGKQPNQYHFLAVEDYSRMVSVSYQRDDVLNKRFFIHGPRGFLFHDALKKYCSVISPEIMKISNMPYWLSKIIAKLGNKEEMKFASELMAFFEQVGEKGDPTEANLLLGAPIIELDEWLNQRKVKLDKFSAG